MNDKDYIIEKKRVKKFLVKWQEILNLRSHNLTTVWDRAYRQENNNVAMHVECSWQYKQIHITIYMPVTAENDDIQLEHICVHELSHALLSPIAQHLPEDVPDDYHEFATESVAQALEWAYAAGKNEKK